MAGHDEPNANHGRAITPPVIGIGTPVVAG
jgi:hypothetical protein